MKRRLLAVALGLAVLLGLFALGLFPQGFVKSLVEARLSTALDVEVTIERLHVVPWRLSAAAGGISIRSLALHVRVAELRLEALPGMLRGAGVALRSLEIRGLEVEARPEVDSSPPAAPAAGAPHVLIRNLKLTGGRLRYSDPALGGDVLASEIEATGSIGDGALDVRLGTLRFERQPAPPAASLRARIEIGPDLRASMPQAEISTARSKLRASGLLGSLTSPAPDLQVEAQLDTSEFAELGGLAVTRGVLQAKGQVKAGASLEWNGDLTAAALESRGLALSGLKAQASGRGSDVSGRLAVGCLGGQVSFEGRLTNGRLDARADATGIQAEAVGRLAGLQPAPQGALSGLATLRGPLSKLDATVAIAGPELSLDGTPLSIRAEADGSLVPESRDLRLAWSLHGEALPDQALGPVRVVGARITASGTVAGAGAPTLAGQARGQLEIAGTPPRAVPFEIQYRGRGEQVEALGLRVAETSLAGLAPGAAGFAAIELEARGPVHRLSGAARLAARDVSWREVRVGAIRLDAASRKGDWSLTGSAPEHALGLEATSPFPGAAARQVSGALTLANSFLAPLAPLLPASLPQDGRVSGRLGFEGPLAEPSALRMRSDLDLVGAGYQARLQGTAGPAQESPLDLQLTGQADAAALDRAEAVDVTGTLAADVRLRGTRTEPTAIGSVRFTGGRISGRGVPEVRVAEALVTLDGPHAELRPSVLALADGQVTASGRAPLSGSGPAELHLEWTGLAAEQLLQALAAEGSTPVGLRARLSGRADLKGRGSTLADWQADATLRAENVRSVDLAIDVTPLDLHLDRGVLEAAPVTLRSDSGSLGLQGRFDLNQRRLDVEGKGALDLRALSPLVGNASITGVAEIDLAVSGAFDAPSPRGAVVVRDAAIRSRDIPEALTGLGARLVFEADRLRLEEARATLGGGSVTASGQGTLDGTSLADLRVDFRGRDMALRYPVGLRSRLNADLALTRANDGFLLSGDVRALRGVYNLDLAIEQSVKAPVVEPQPSALLRSIGMDIRVVLDSPVLVRNKLANVDVEGNLQFRGDLETPAPFGRLEIASGGKIFVAGRDFAVETGRLAYSGDWDPEVTLRATRRVRDESDLTEHDVALVAQGKFSTVQPVLRAEGLTDGQALSLVATGRTTGTAGKTLGARVAGQQAANLALGQLSQSLGLDEVTVQPELLARETDPGTRFTFGKQLTPMLSLIYSMSLNSPEQRFTQVEARLGHGISVKGQRTDDGVFAAGAGQRFRLGGVRKRATSDERVRLTDVRFEGELPEEAREAVEAKTGKRVAAWDVQEDADRLRRRLVDEGYVEAQVGGRIEAAAAVFQVQAGPRFAWRVEGLSSPPDLAEAFRAALYEEDAVERGRTRLIETLRKRGHLRGRVAVVRPEDRDGRRTLVFEVDPGPILEARVVFPGAHGLSQGDLLKAVGGAGALLTEPGEALARLTQAYASAGRFAVKVGPVEVEETPGAVRIRVPVDEGDLPRVAGVHFAGASLPEDTLKERSGLAVGVLYSAEAVAAAAERIRNHYYALGYAQAGVVAENTLRGADVEVRFQVREGGRLVVGAVEIVGLRRTRESIVRREVPLKPGDAVDPRRLANIERRLLDLGIFSQVLVTAGSDDPATVRIELVEKERIEAAYDLRWSEETRTTIQVDAEVRNLAGLGLNLGGRYRVGGDDREKRASLLVPSFRRGKFSVAAFETQEDLADIEDPVTDEILTNTQTERVIEFQQTMPVKRRTNLLAGYRFKTISSTVFPEPIRVANLDLGGVREARDSPLDARSGHFAALSFQIAPESLGSDVTYVKGFGQFFLHRRLSRAWTWSQGYRLGLAQGFGDPVIPSERFEAGGPDSLRGFAQNSLGPKNVSGDPAGGEAVVILNQELRYRQRSGWGFALFWDVGNVFPTVRDLGLHLRHDLGAGLRWVSPVGLLRLDLAFPLDRQPEEDKYQLFFSLGQAF